MLGGGGDTSDVTTEEQRGQEIRADELHIERKLRHVFLTGPVPGGVGG